MSTVARVTPELVAHIVSRVRSEVGTRAAEIFENCFSDTLSNTLEDMDDGTLFMVTGDIPAMWLRDSTAQLAPYLHFVSRDPVLSDTVARISRRQLANLLQDPYANAFNRGPTGESDHADDLTDMAPGIWERKYEVDSLCYPVQLAHALWIRTGRTDHLERDFVEAARAIVALWRREQDHAGGSGYSFQRLDAPAGDTLADGGQGAPVGATGMTWSGFRPSDDACQYGYNVPANAFAAVELRHLEQIAREVFGDAALANEAAELRGEIEEGIRSHGLLTDSLGRTRYAYEVDGLGSTLSMDDANVPSLLSLPLLGWCDADDPIYLATRAHVLSDDNPSYYRGAWASGVGSPHTPAGSIWPIALAVQGLTSTDLEEKGRLVDLLCATDAGTGLMHESFSVNDPTVFTRPWFSWANAMFCELVLDVAGLRTSIEEMPASR